MPLHDCSPHSGKLCMFSNDANSTVLLNSPSSHWSIHISLTSCAGDSFLLRGSFTLFLPEQFLNKVEQSVGVCKSLL